MGSYVDLETGNFLVFFIWFLQLIEVVQFVVTILILDLFLSRRGQ